MVKIVLNDFHLLKMSQFKFLLLIIIIFGIFVEMSSNFEIITRDKWHAKPAKAIEKMSIPVPYVVIHHSYEPKVCKTLNECIKSVQSIQNFHQNTNLWNDIGYNFLIGGDGRAYIGRGWDIVGAHSPKYNNISIGICLIGDWRFKLPTNKQLLATKQLINIGLKLNFIENNYQLFGHRQLRPTECPGDTLFTHIKTWQHFSDNPPWYYNDTKHS